MINCKSMGKSDLIDAIRNTVSKWTDVPVNQVFLSLTHTHSGLFLTLFACLSEERKQVVINYLKKLLYWSSDAAGAASDLHPLRPEGGMDYLNYFGSTIDSRIIEQWKHPNNCLRKNH